MNIFNIFAGGIILILVIRLVVIVFNFNKTSGADKITQLLGTLISIILISISWAVIYAFFGYDENYTIEKEKPKSSIVKFNDKNKNGK